MKVKLKNIWGIKNCCSFSLPQNERLPQRQRVIEHIQILKINDNFSMYLFAVQMQKYEYMKLSTHEAMYGKGEGGQNRDRGPKSRNFISS